jgi:hypothetical protein
MEDELAARRIEDRSILSGEGVERAAARQCKVTIPPADCNRGQLMIGFVVMVIEYLTKVKVDVALHRQLGVKNLGERPELGPKSPVQYNTY